MKNRKKDFVLIIAGIIFAALVIYIGVNLSPKNRMIKEIAAALQPVLKSENQSMRLDVNTVINEKTMQMNADIYMVEAENRQYLVVESQDFPIYITDNILLLKNGKAFKIADEVQNKAIDYKNLFLQISTVYKVLDFTCEKSDLEKAYMVEVTGEDMETLLAMLPIENEILNGIEKIQVKLVTRDKKLNRIEIWGSADVYEKNAELSILMSDFKVLTEEYEIPSLVKESVNNVDVDSLFSLSEDLYRLITVAKNFSQKENIDGTIYITANCGMLKINNKSNLGQLSNSSGNSGISVNIEGISEMIALLCLEGDISCTEDEGKYVYQLELSQETMQNLAQALVPELVNYVVDFSKGSSEVVVKDESISTIKIEIAGSINVLMTDIPANVSAEICFQ